MTKFTKSAVVQALAEIVAETGEDYIYPYAVGQGSLKSCQYAEEGVPSCIVGRVIAKLDPELFNEVQEVEQNVGSFAVSDFSTPGNPSGTSEWTYPELDADKWVINVLDAVQQKQDNGKPYGPAVLAAINYADGVNYPY